MKTNVLFYRGESERGNTKEAVSGDEKRAIMPNFGKPTEFTRECFRD
ncbi:MAG: hypothetical protein IPP55_11570 [Anaerolineales bacterium]|nr:hypothetical protein [Anaerolineales bacterium]